MARYAFLRSNQAEDEAITQGKLPIKNEASVLKLSSISYRVALDEDWPTSIGEMMESEECPVLDFIPVDWRGYKTTEEWATLFLVSERIRH